MEEYAREPCPYRIVDDCGGAFAMGCIGGGVFQAIKGFRNAPSGFSRRMVRVYYFLLQNYITQELIAISIDSWAAFRLLKRVHQ